MNTADTFYREAISHLTRTPPDFEAAVPLLRQAAQAGHAESAFQLAGCLLQGLGISADRQAGIRLMQQAAGSGHPYARYNLLQIQESQGMPFNTLMAAYKELAEEGIIHAQLKLMRSLHDGGRHEEALQWAYMAAAQHHPQALYFLAQHHQYASPPDFAQAHLFYRQAAEQDFPAAHWQLGLQYKLGQGTDPNKQLAVVHLRHAADSGIAAAQTMLADLLLETDPQEAIHRLKAAARGGSSDAQVRLAEIYLLGKWVERNTGKAHAYAEKAAAQQHSEALRILGDIYRYGLGVVSDPIKARRYYRQAADKGNIQAHQKLLADIALGNKPDEYAEAKEKALKKQEAEQLYQQAFAAHYGLNRHPDHSEALRLYESSALLGHGKAQTNLGMMYYNGHGTAQNYAKAAEWFEKAALNHDAMAQYNLACLYFNGTGIAHDADEACRWLEAAIRNGHDQPEVLKQLLAQWRQAAA